MESLIAAVRHDAGRPLEMTNSLMLALDTTSPSLPPLELQTSLFRRQAELTVLPAIAAQALEIANNPDCSIKEFAKLIGRDLKLASDILTIANSAIYSGGSPVTGLSQAVSRLGFRRCKNLILTTSLTGLMQRISFDEQWIRDILWRHSFLTAIHCHHLNRVFQTGFEGEEFTAGLIHDFGRTLLAVAVPERFNDADALDFREGEDVIARERTILDTDHAEFGAWFARHSNLPEPLVEVMRDHHRTDGCSRLTALVITADHMTNHLQKYLEPDQYDASENPGAGLLEQWGCENVAELLASESIHIMEEAAHDLTDLTKRV